MAYVSKQWKDRQVEYPNRRTITHDDLTQEVVSVNRNEGTIYEAGDVLDSVNMNNLESRIAAGLNEKQNILTAGQGITIENNVISATGGGGGASALVDLTDTDISSPTDKQALVYDASTQKWKNGSSAGFALDKTASGSVVSFNDGADDLPVIDLTAQIEANLSGFTGVNVVVCGSNLWNEETEAGYMYVSNGQIYYSTNNTTFRSKDYIPVKEGNYYFVCNGYSSYRIFSFDSSFGNPVQLITGASSKVVEIPSGVAYIKFYVEKGNKEFANDISINYPSSDTDYHAYNGTTYSVTWQTEAGTVHGGYINLTTGLLTVMHEMCELTGADITAVTTEGGLQRARLTTSGELSSANHALMKCNLYTPQVTAGEGVITWVSAGQKEIWIYDSRFTDLATAQSILNSNHVILVYPLATPQTYQLTPTEVKTLLGNNTIVADTGNLSLDYQTEQASDIIEVVQPELDKKQDTLTAGTGISIVNNVISATGGGGGTTYTAGDNITIDSNDVISARRVPQNILFGGDDLRVAYKPVLFSESSMEFFGGHGFVIEETSSDSIIYTVEDARLDLGESYTLRLRIDINGTMFEYKIEHISSSVYNTTFTLDGMEFQIGIINVLPDSFVLQNFYSSDKTSQDDLYLVGISLEEETNSELPLNNKDSQITALINKKMESVYYTDTLIAGNTSLVITDDEDILTSDSLIDIYTDEFGVDPTAVSVSLGVTNTITLTFEARQTDLGVKVRIYK